MAKPRVTITLGGSGKVVKMGDDVMVGHGRLSRSKRFTPDKPWTNGGADNVMSSNKRQQGNGAKWRSGGSRGQGRRMRNSEKLRDIRPQRHLSKHPPILGTSGIDHLNRITHKGISDDLHMYSLETMDESRVFVEMPKLTPSDLARADLFSSNGGFDPSKGEELFTVSTLLNSLGLGKYAIHFKAEEVDMTALRHMGDRDLKELGMPMGPRKKLLLALTPPSKGHQSRMRL